MRKRKTLSRRRKALRRVLVAAAVLLVVNDVFGIGLLFPIQAIRHNEERLGTGRTAVICRDWEPRFRWNSLTYLTGSENITMLSGTDLGLYGWGDGLGVALDCSEEAPIHGGWWSLSQKPRLGLLYVFGRIDDSRIEQLVVYRLREEDPLEEEKVGRLPGTWGIDRDSQYWMEKDGRSYFLLDTYPFDWEEEYPYGFRIVALGYDAEGTEIARVELEQGAFSYFV